MTEDVSSSLWWSIPQVVVWIVTRSESKVLRAGSLRTAGQSLASSAHRSLRPRAGKRIISIDPWPRRPSPSRLPRRGVSLRQYFDTRSFWSSLSLRADDCKRCWPTPVSQTAQTPRLLTAARRPSDGEVLALIEEKRKAFRAERKRAGRDVLLRAAMNHFDLSRKVVLDIWNGTPRDRKGGRPKKAKPGTDRPIVKRVR